MTIFNLVGRSQSVLFSTPFFFSLSVSSHVQFKVNNHNKKHTQVHVRTSRGWNDRNAKLVVCVPVPCLLSAENRPADLAVCNDQPWKPTRSTPVKWHGF